MKILCLVKPVPDVENFRYDYEKNILVRENVHLILNPEDTTALAFALSIKAEAPQTVIETLTMAPMSASPHLEDLIRRGVDHALLVSDPLYAGSDTYVTSRILSRCIAHRHFDWIVAGTHTLDGGTGHVPAQMAESLGIPHMSNIAAVDRQTLLTGRVLVDVDRENALLRFELSRPAILGFHYSTKIKLPYIGYEEMNRDVSSCIEVLTNKDLAFDPMEVGLSGSPTKVGRAEVRKLNSKDTLFVRNDNEGIEQVYQFLKKRGFVGK
jgi:electron transfer flavoprotein beta subunit